MIEFTCGNCQCIFDKQKECIDILKQACEYALDGLCFTDRDDVRKNAIAQVRAALKAVEERQKDGDEIG